MKTSPILEQINAIWTTLRHPDTGDAVLSVSSSIWTVLTRLVLLIILLVLLVVAAAIWWSGSAFQKGREYRAWLNQDPVPSNEEFQARIVQDIQAFLTGFADFAGAIALKLLGVPDATPPSSDAQPKALTPGTAPKAGIVAIIPAKQRVN